VAFEVTRIFVTESELLSGQPAFHAEMTSALSIEESGLSAQFFLPELRINSVPQASCSDPVRDSPENLIWPLLDGLEQGRDFFKARGLGYMRVRAWIRAHGKKTISAPAAVWSSSLAKV